MTPASWLAHNGISRSAAARLMSENPGTRTLLTEVDIPNASHELFPGMFVYVGIAIGPSGSRWRGPATAVIIDAPGTRGAAVGPHGKLHLQPILLRRGLGNSHYIHAG